MKKIKMRINDTIPILMMFFIAIQPILDLSTAYTKLALNIDFTPGIIIRASFIILGALYTLFKAFEEKNKGYLLYLIIISIFFVTNLVVSYFNKPIFNLFSEVVSIGKIIYFTLMFKVFILVLRDLKANKTVSKYFPKNIVISQLIISVSMFVSDITDTSFEAYDGILKTGASGWFFAPNELGTLLAICFPVLIWYALKQDRIIKILFGWIVVIGSMYSLISIGTKVGYLAILITFIMSIIALMLDLSLKTLKKIKKRRLLKYLIVFGTFVLFIYLTPDMPVTKNTNSHIRWIGESSQVNGSITSVENSIKDIFKSPNHFNDLESDKTEENKNIESDPQEKLANEILFSGRDGFLKKHKNDYDNANIIQKIFGMGYSANYTISPLMIERDFHDIFFQYGWLGTFLIFLPFLFYGTTLLVFTMKNILFILHFKYILILSGILLGLGIAFISGHTLTAPAVSSYLSLLLAYIVVDLELDKGKSFIGIRFNR